MNDPAITQNYTWADERVRWRHHYLDQLERQVNWATDYVCANQRQIETLTAHWDSLFAILNQARRFSHLHSAVIRLITELGVWPVRWGHWQSWEGMLRFAVEQTAAAQESSRHTLLLDHLAYLLLDSGRQDEALVVGREVISRAQPAGTTAPVASIADLMIYVLSQQGKTAEAEEVLVRVEQLVMYDVCPQPELAPLYFSHVRINRRWGRLDEALIWANRAVAALEGHEEGQRHRLADAWNVRGVTHWALGHYGLAAADLQSAINRYLQTNDHPAEARIQGTLGLVYWSMGELDQAETAIRRALSLVARPGEQWRLVRDTGNLGLVYLARGDLKRAWVHIEEQLRLAQAVQDTHELTRGQANRGIVRLHQGHFAVALDDIEPDLAFYEQNGNAEGLICDRVNVARCQAGLGRHAEALALAQQTLEMACAANAPALRIIALRGLAEQLPMAAQEPLLREALAFAQQTGRQLDEAACLLSLAGLQNDPEQMRLWRQGARLLRKIGRCRLVERLFTRATAADSPDCLNVTCQALRKCLARPT